MNFKSILALIIALSMIVCVCGCSSNDTASESSVLVEVEHQDIYLDESGNEITGGDTNTSSAIDTSSSDKVVDNSSSSKVSTTTSNKQSSEIDYTTTVEIDICDDVIRGYLDAATAERQYSMLKEFSNTKYDYQKAQLDWILDGSKTYTITVSENADFSNSYTIKTKFQDVTNATFVPGKTYYWKVVGDIVPDVLGGGKIHIKDAPVRWIWADGTGNVRDMGGWKTESGKTVKYELLYRGKNLDNLTQTGIETLKSLGLKTELDLRYLSQKNQRQGTGMNYVFLETSAQYDRIFKEAYKDEVTANYKRIFSLLSDKGNYPFYTHCSAGADRTGTFAFILNGLLGVSYEDLTRDFELTSFSSSGKRWRGQGNGATFVEGDTVMQNDSGNYVAWGELYKAMMEYGSKNGYTTLSQSIEHWLTSYVGVPKSQIDSFKSIMLD